LVGSVIVVRTTVRLRLKEKVSAPNGRDRNGAGGSTTYLKEYVIVFHSLEAAFMAHLTRDGLRRRDERQGAMKPIQVRPVAEFSFHPGRRDLKRVIVRQRINLVEHV